MESRVLIEVAYKFGVTPLVQHSHFGWINSHFSLFRKQNQTGASVLRFCDFRLRQIAVFANCSYWSLNNSTIILYGRYKVLSLKAQKKTQTNSCDNNEKVT